MTLKKIANNVHEIHTISGDVVLFSYDTPVAARIEGSYFKTEKSHSVTTSGHIGRWINGSPVSVKPQSFFDNLLEVKLCGS